MGTAVHVGAALLQVMFAWHVVVAVPTSEKPASQLYIAREPNVVDGTVTEPFVGAASPGQLTGTHVGAMELKVAFA